MNKQTKIVLGVIVIVAIVGGILYYKRNKKMDAKSKKDEETIKQQKEILKIMYQDTFSDEKIKNASMSDLLIAKQLINEGLKKNTNKSDLLKILQIGLQDKDFTQDEYNELVRYLEENQNKLMAENSIKLARSLGVPESEIIKNIDELDAFMQG
jgi:hypothetical protein